MKNFIAAAVITVGFIALFAALFVGGSLMYGWAIQKLWLWFVVPVFSLPSLTFPQAIGLGFLVRFMTTELENSDDKPTGWENAVARVVTTVILRPLIAVGTGWIVVQFM